MEQEFIFGKHLFNVLSPSEIEAAKEFYRILGTAR